MFLYNLFTFYRKFKRINVIFLMALLFAARTLQAQSDTAIFSNKPHREKAMAFIGGGLQRGFIFAHSQSVQNTKGAHPTGVEFFLGNQRNDAAVWNLCHCYPRKGLLLSYYNYDTRILGSSFSASWFLEPVYRLRKNLFFSFRGTAGASYLTRPFDSITNPANQSYSTHLSAYFTVGLGLWIRVRDRWWLQPSVNYQHESNGGLRQPNKGINWPTAGLAFSYQKTERPFYSGRRMKEKYWKQDPLRWDAGIFGIARRVLNDAGDSRRVPLVGFVMQGSKQVGAIHALTLGAEVYRDEELRLRLNREAVGASPVKAGILAGHEFLLGRVIFSQRLGMYFFDQTPYYDRLYHRWGLQYRIHRRIGFGFNLQVHRHVADYVDLRFTYTIRDHQR